MLLISQSKMIFSLLIATLLLFYIFIPMLKWVRYLSAAVLVGGIYLLFLPSIYKNYQLEKKGIHTTGILLAKKCEGRNSQIISYKFQVENKEYLGKGTPGVGNQTCETFQLGEQVFITYLASDLGINTPEREVRSGVFLSLIFSFSMFAFLIWLNSEQTRFRKEKLSKRVRNV
ncbi:hypothetical protein EJN92_16920 [Undibacterium parvum]|uniref:DUF3592 domain-containing protein n=2 Tax=Undibacterium parvum TaxID=401471 RepID=A0A3Q9BSY1_9BURK|nr:hypothetical protein EJN92_16920 [Undibacterium parvum]